MTSPEDAADDQPPTLVDAMNELQLARQLLERVLPKCVIANCYGYARVENTAYLGKKYCRAHGQANGPVRDLPDTGLLDEWAASKVGPLTHIADAYVPAGEESNIEKWMRMARAMETAISTPVGGLCFSGHPNGLKEDGRRIVCVLPKKHEGDHLGIGPAWNPHAVRWDNERSTPRKKAIEVTPMRDGISLVIGDGEPSAGPASAPPSAASTLPASQAAIAAECDELKAMLLAKNEDYGDSALHPVRIFSKASPEEQILVRIDDKVNRIIQGKASGEDVTKDLIGYFILLRVHRRLTAKETK